MASSSKTRPTPRSRKASSTHSCNSSSTTARTSITINVYDLLPPGKLSTVLWTLGSSLLHSGVVINNETPREYAYGGHNKPSLTGVYYTSPNYTPPGGTHRLAILQGYTYRTDKEIQEIVKAVSERFLGTSYNLLTNNCNHFTNALVEALTGRQAPGWLNRAASIGLALPCMVPREWIQPPDVDTAEGALLEDGHEHDRNSNGVGPVESAVYKDIDEEEDDASADERASMLESERHARLREEQRRYREEELRVRKEKRKSQRLSTVSTSKSGGGSSSIEEEAISLAGGKRITTVDEPPPRLVKGTDSAGRELPVAERAPLPKSAVTASRT